MNATDLHSPCTNLTHGWTFAALNAEFAAACELIVRCRPMEATPSSDRVVLLLANDLLVRRGWPSPLSLASLSPGGTYEQTRDAVRMMNSHIARLFRYEWKRLPPPDGDPVGSGMRLQELLDLMVGVIGEGVCTEAYAPACLRETGWESRLRGDVERWFLPLGILNDLAAEPWGIVNDLAAEP